MRMSNQGQSGQAMTAVTEHQVAGRDINWWGMIFFIASEALIFANLIASYLYLEIRGGSWRLPNGDQLDWRYPLVNTIILLLSSVPVRFAGAGIAKGNRRNLVIGLTGTIILGVHFPWRPDLRIWQSLRAALYATDASFWLGVLYAHGFPRLARHDWRHFPADYVDPFLTRRLHTPRITLVYKQPRCTGTSLTSSGSSCSVPFTFSPLSVGNSKPGLDASGEPPLAHNPSHSAKIFFPPLPEIVHRYIFYHKAITKMW